jgi:signal peptidase II
MRPVARAAALAAGIVAVDQVTKAIVRGAVDRGGSEQVLPFLDLVNTRNTGVAFGLLDGAGWIVTAVTLVALAALLVFFAFNQGRRYAWIPTGLLVGGAVGNMIDRLGGDGVTDFVKLPAWPAFNVADVCITVGVVALVLVLEQPRRPRREPERALAADG